MPKCPRTAVYTYKFDGEEVYYCADHMAKVRAVCDRFGLKIDVREYTGKEKCISLKGEEGG